jgi:uncharacterized lipoprotein YbaY
VVHIPSGSYLDIRLQDTSLADAPAITLNQAYISNLSTFPIRYQMIIPTNSLSQLTYSLSARILQNDRLLYINDRYIQVVFGNDSTITVDIPVIGINQGLNVFFAMNKSKIEKNRF